MLAFDNLNLHYLSSGFDVDVMLPAGLSSDQLASLEQVDFDALRRTLGARQIGLPEACGMSRLPPYGARGDSGVD